MPSLRSEDTGVGFSATDQKGAWIEDVTAFDRHYFGLSRSEAELIDPRQRKLLQLAVRTIGDAGYSPMQLRGRDVSVVIAATSSPAVYDLLSEDGRLNPHSLTGSMGALASGRIAYHLDLRGAAMTVDTACSSFLVALHEARVKLSRGEGEMVLVGGFETVLGRPPQRPKDVQGLGVLSESGGCRPFDTTSDGTTFGEGGGFVLIKRLSDAVQDGDPIYAVIKGSAVNQDASRSSGLTSPSASAQAEVIAAALENAQVTPAQIGYIEAHGTGTRIGDPIEIQGLAAVFGSGETPRSTATPVSSVKGNFGHLDGMASFAGVVRIVAQLRAGAIFPTASFTAPNPLLSLSGSGLRIAEMSEPWQTIDDERIASISSFGLSGTNAHAVVAGYRQGAASEPSHVGDRVIVLSAQTALGLDTYVSDLKLAMSGESADVNLSSIADTLMFGRDHSASMPYRVAWVVSGHEDLAACLKEYVPDAGSPARTARDVVLVMGHSDADTNCPNLAEIHYLASRFAGFARVLLDSNACAPLESLSARQRSLLWSAGAGVTLADFGVVPATVLAHGNGVAVSRYVRGDESMRTLLADHDIDDSYPTPHSGRLELALDEFRGQGLVVDLVAESVLSRAIKLADEGYVRTHSGPRFEQVLASLHTHGVILHWPQEAFTAPTHLRANLPTGPFVEEKLWPDHSLFEANAPVRADHGGDIDDAAAASNLLETAPELVLRFAREVLKEPTLELANDFFAEGGDSLNAMTLVSKLNMALAINLDVSDLFDHQTLGDLAEELGRTSAPLQEALSENGTDAGPEKLAGGLSGQQLAIWAATQLSPLSPAYNVSGAFVLAGDADENDLQVRLASAVSRHEMLRTHLVDSDLGPTQIVLPASDVPPDLQRIGLDLSMLTATSEAGQSHLHDALRALVSEPLSPYASPPTRYQLVRTQFADTTVMTIVVTFHHLFFDGWSWHIFMQSLTATPDINICSRTYLDFVQGQNDMLTGARGRVLGTFWRSQLDGAPLSSPSRDPVFAGQPGETSESGDGDIVDIPIDGQLLNALKILAQESRTTLNVVLLAAWTTLLWQITESEDVVVAGPVSGRGVLDEDVIGCYANTVVVRSTVMPGRPFADVLASVRSAQFAALAHGDLPADRIIRIARPDSAEPVASTNFGYQVERGLTNSFGPGGPEIEMIDVDPAAPTFELNVSMLDRGTDLIGTLKFDQSLFYRDTVSGWAAEYVGVLKELVRTGTQTTVFDLFEASNATTSGPLPEFNF